MLYVGIAVAALFGISLLIFLFLQIQKWRTTGAGAKRRSIDLAMVQLTKQLQRNPDDAGAITKMAVLKIRKGDLKSGMDDLQRALQIDPGQTEAHYQLGLIFYQQKDWGGAAREFSWIMNNSEDPLFKTAIREKYTDLRTKKYV